jgi:drug/metabolite transporter (DMT)-like permease
VAFGAYLTLLGRIGAARAGYAMVMFPVVALVISFFFEGLQPRPSIFAGVALVLAGNLLILRGRSARAVPAAARPATTDAAIPVFAELAENSKVAPAERT